MAQYIMCEKCKKVVEYKPETRYEGGISTTIFKCPECGHVKESSVNHIHYGNDGKK
jgi:DNA-directed RNA polymerase subunit M/transcription elongation factor TFIIS